jgi:hypothetical protein
VTGEKKTTMRPEGSPNEKKKKICETKNLRDWEDKL